MPGTRTPSLGNSEPGEESTMLSFVKVFFVLAAFLFSGLRADITLSNFAVASASAQFLSFNGSANNVLPGAPIGLIWNAAVSGQPTGEVDWLVFDLLVLNFQVTEFSFQALGDNVHDPATFKLQTGLSAFGPWTDLQSFTASTGTTVYQYFTLSTPTAGRYWRWVILTRASQYQSYVQKVNFIGNFVTTPQPLNNFAAIDFISQYPTGPANYLLPTTNPLANPSVFWDALASLPNWITFDVFSNLNVSGFQFSNIGDNVHDATSVNLQYSVSPNGPYSLAQSFSASSSAGIQSFYLTSPVVSRYWRFYVTATDGNYQGYIAYFNFLIYS